MEDVIWLASIQLSEVNYTQAVKVEGYLISFITESTRDIITARVGMKRDVFGLF